MERTITIDIDKVLGEIFDAFNGFLSDYRINNKEEFTEAYSKSMSYLFYKLNNIYKLGIIDAQELIDEYVKGANIVNEKKPNEESDS